jgi:hypothetical protein
VSLSRALFLYCFHAPAPSAMHQHKVGFAGQPFTSAFVCRLQLDVRPSYSPLLPLPPQSDLQPELQ